MEKYNINAKYFMILDDFRRGQQEMVFERLKTDLLITQEDY